MPVVAVEGGTEEQQALLRSILAGLEERDVEAIGIESWVDDFEEHASLGLVPTEEEINESHGTAVRLVRARQRSIRAQWEIMLVAAAFRVRSAELGLERVVVLHTGEASMRLGARELIPPLAADDVRRMRHEIATVIEDAGGDLDKLTILRPAGHAWAVSVRVAEPHAFLRDRFRLMLDALEPWAEACGRQRYIEVCDGEPDPAVVLAQYAFGGFSSERSDVSCCSPLVSFGVGIDAPLSPGCPVFG